MNKLISTKNTNALFLASILFVGIIGITSFTAYGESYQSANCDDTNININGINQEQIQRQNQNNNFDAAATEAQQLSPEEETLKALTGNGEPLLNVNRNIVNICINDNDNSLDVELFGTQEQLPPEPTIGTLTVSKELTCGQFPDFPPEFSPPPTLCQELIALITPDQFLFQVEGNNPDPSSPFPGLEAGTDVTLGPGNYVVDETETQSVIDDANNFLNNHLEVFSFQILLPSFTGNCTNVIGNGEATGTIAAEDSQTCIGVNQIRLAAFPIP